MIFIKGMKNDDIKYDLEITNRSKSSPVRIDVVWNFQDVYFFFNKKLLS